MNRSITSSHSTIHARGGSVDSRIHWDPCRKDAPYHTTRSPPAWGLHPTQPDSCAQPWLAYPPTRCCSRPSLVRHSDPRLSSLLQDGSSATVRRRSMPPFRHLKGSTDHIQRTRPVSQLRWPLFLLW